MSAQSQQWINNAGPRKSKPAVAALTRLRREADNITVLTGVRGCTEGWEAESSHTISRFGIGVRGPANNPRALELYAELGEKYAWTLTNDNLAAIEADAARMIAEAVKSRKIEDERRDPEEDAAQKREQAERAEVEAAERDRIQASNARILAKRPSWAKALIVAIETIDMSEMQSDYSGHRDGRVVAIGWRSGSREDFKQLRAAAGRFAETAHLGPGCDDYTVRVQLRDTGELYARRCGHELDGQHFTTREAALSAIDAAGLPAVSSNFRPDVAQPEDIENGRMYATVEQASVEHRDNYSMGHGNYLMRGWINNDGWRVESYGISEDGTKLTSGWREIEDGLQPTPDKPTGGGGGSDTPGGEQRAGSSNTPAMALNAEKNGVELRFPGKPDEATREQLSANGFRVTRRPPWVWYAKQTPEAIEYARRVSGSEQQTDMEQLNAGYMERLADGRDPWVPRKLRAVADRLQRDIDKRKPYDGMNPTRKRIQAWDQHAKEIARAERLQRALRQLAAWQESGQWPEWVDTMLRVNPAGLKIPNAEVIELAQPYLDGNDGERPVTTECTRGLFAQAVALLQSVRKLDAVQDILRGWQLDHDAQQARAVARWLLLTATPEDPKREHARKIEAAERELLRCDIPGFFPTPPEIARQMVEAAEIEPGMRVLEPSAGAGAIADAIREAGAEPICCEVNHRLLELLSLKGYQAVSGEFIERFSLYDPAPDAAGIESGTIERFDGDSRMRMWDRILMNPPFEDSQDIAHVMHAYKLLAPGGRLVALMGPGGWFRSDRKAQAFREWLHGLICTPDCDDIECDSIVRAGGNVASPGEGPVRWQDLLEGSFKQSGTSCAVRMLVIDKPALAEAQQDAPPRYTFGFTGGTPAEFAERRASEPAPAPDFGGLEAQWEESALPEDI